MSQPREVRLGVDYFPEQWPESRWPRDLQLMREAGLRVVRIAEFSWSKTQPRAGVWDWAWLDRAVDAIAEAGLEVILCTPTACPPPWMIQAEPSILPEIVGPHGRQAFGLGHRRHYSPHHAGYQTACADFAARLARRWAGHQAVIGYQIDNELVGALNDVGPLAQQAFASWLQQRHGSLQALDEHLGLIFWGQQYDDWAQIPVPVDGRFHPGLWSEFMRFSSQAWVAFCRRQSSAMRPELRQDQLLTSNCYLPYWGMVMDWDELMRDGGLDVFAFDNYARSADDGAFFNDLARSIHPRYWILEQQCGSTAGQHIWPDRIGRIAEDTGIAIDKGAEIITYFRWRQARFGNEQDHGAILDHHGETGPIYHEITAVCQQLATRAEPPALPRPSLGCSFTWVDQWFAASANPSVDFCSLVRETIAVAAQHAEVDIHYALRPEQLAGLEMLLLPLRLEYDLAWEQAICDLVAAGGTVVGFPLLFAKDCYNAYRTEYLSPVMQELFGLRVLRRIPLRREYQGEACPLPCRLGVVETVARAYLEELAVASGTQVLAEFDSGPLAGKPLVSERHHAGGGRAVMCAAYLDAAGVGELLAMLAEVD